MLRTKLARRPHCVSPVELDMRPIANPDLLLQETNYLALLALGEQTRALGLAKAIEYLDPLPWRPQHFSVGGEVKEA